MYQRTAYRGGAALMALPFIGVGVYCAGFGFGYLPEPDGVNAPLWVVGCIGLAFAIAGLWLLTLGLGGMRHHARRKRIVELYPERPWLSDYAWDDSGIESRPFARAVGSLYFAALWCIFMTPFYWWAFLSGEGNWFVKGIVGLFCFFTIFVLKQAFSGVVHAFKYGRTRLRFHTFPFHPGGKLDVDFEGNRFEELTATLRFVEERIYEDVDQKKDLVARTLHSDEQTLTPGPFQPVVRLVFDLPDDEELVNEISGDPVRFWELEIRAPAPGVDFHVVLPVPVYSPRGKRKATAASGGKVTISD